MQRTVGRYDRLGRLLIGAVLVVIAVAGYAGVIPLAVGPLSQALTAIVLLVVGAILLVTGYLQQCPIWAAVGINTLRRG